MPKKTIYVRVRVDLILEFGEALDSLPKGMGDNTVPLCDAVAERLAKAVTPKPVAWSDGQVGYGLYFSSKKQDGKLAKARSKAKDNGTKKKRG